MTLNIILTKYGNYGSDFVTYIVIFNTYFNKQYIKTFGEICITDVTRG